MMNALKKKIQAGVSWISEVSHAIIFPVRKAKHFALDFSVLLLVAVLGTYVLFPTIANADMEREQVTLDDQTVALIIEQMKNETRPYGHLPESDKASARRTIRLPVTAYTSEVGQTDNSPCVTASGLDVCERDTENIVAANFLPMGTRVRIPELYGDRVFYVEDRMNQRYRYHLDVWMKQKDAAKQFGLKYVTVEIF
ncbi:3D domain-containing protein [Candidatus Uhrbacteria bacterium]|nr:3D domain-containing protein [Candidatus Uhrbacteria bacterium]